MSSHQPPDALRPPVPSPEPSPSDETPSRPAPARFAAVIPRSLDVRRATNPARAILWKLVALVGVTALIAGAIFMGPAMLRKRAATVPATLPHGDAPRHTAVVTKDVLTPWL